MVVEFQELSNHLGIPEAQTPLRGEACEHYYNPSPDGSHKEAEDVSAASSPPMYVPPRRAGERILK